MKINGSSKIGIWKYSQTSEYERGDFIVVGDKIYYCESDVSGVLPDSPGSEEYFSMYPGNMIKTKEEYYKILENPEVATDMYVSGRALTEILQDSFFGLGCNGEIVSKVDYSGSEEIASGFSHTLSGGRTVVDDIITDPDYNNGVALLSRDLPSIKRYIGSSGGAASGSTNYIYCDRNKCIGCWNCIKVCRGNYIKKTITNELVIHNGNDGGNAENWNMPVSICPTGALAYSTEDSPEVQREMEIFNSLNNNPAEPEYDIIVYGATPDSTVRVPTTTVMPYDETWTSESIALCFDNSYSLDSSFFSEAGLRSFILDNSDMIFSSSYSGETLSEAAINDLFNNEFSVAEIQNNAVLEWKSGVIEDYTRSDNGAIKISKTTTTNVLNPNPPEGSSFKPLLVSDREGSNASIFLEALEVNSNFIAALDRYASLNLGMPSGSLRVIRKSTKVVQEGEKEETVYNEIIVSSPIDSTLAVIDSIWSRIKNNTNVSQDILTTAISASLLDTSNPTDTYHTFGTYVRYYISNIVYPNIRYLDIHKETSFASLTATTSIANPASGIKDSLHWGKTLDQVKGYLRNDSGYYSTSRSRYEMPPIGRDSEGPLGIFTEAALSVSTDPRSEEARAKVALTNGIDCIRISYRALKAAGLLGQNLNEENEERNNLAALVREIRQQGGYATCLINISHANSTPIIYVGGDMTYSAASSQNWNTYTKEEYQDILDKLFKSNLGDMKSLTLQENFITSRISEWYNGTSYSSNTLVDNLSYSEWEALLNSRAGENGADNLSVISSTSITPRYNTILTGGNGLLDGTVVYDSSISVISTINPSPYVLLRQYTYKSDGVAYRIQELVDQDYGLIWFRSASLRQNKFSNPTDWKEVAANVQAILSKVSEMTNFIESREDRYNTFRYRSLPVDRLTTRTALPAELPDPQLVTVILYETIGPANDRKRTTYTVVLNASGEDDYRYYVNSDVYAYIDSSRVIHIDSDSGNTDIGLLDVYYRESDTQQTIEI